MKNSPLYSYMYKGAPVLKSLQTKKKRSGEGELSPPQSWRPEAQELRQRPLEESTWQNGEDHHKHKRAAGVPPEISNALL